MPGARLIVCEKTGDWAAALRIAAPDLAAQMQQTRSLPECRRALAEHPYSVAAVEAIPDRLPALIAWLARLEDDFPAVRAVVLAQRELRGCEDAFREAGAQSAAFSPRESGPVVRLMRRHLGRAPQDDAPLTEQILDRLPWKRWASPLSAAKAIAVSSNLPSSSPSTPPANP